MWKSKMLKGKHRCDSLITLHFLCPIIARKRIKLNNPFAGESERRKQTLVSG